MLKWSASFLLIAIVAAIFGFTGISEGAASIAKILFGIFIGLCILALVLGLTSWKCSLKILAPARNYPFFNVYTNLTCLLNCGNNKKHVNTQTLLF
jgi:uncharacterized membrane protein YtjA (UPF0391 family)